MTARLWTGLVLFGGAIGLWEGIVVGGFGRPLWSLWFWGVGMLLALLLTLHQPSRAGVRLLAIVLISGLVVSLPAGYVRHHLGTGYAGYTAVSASGGQHVQRGRPWGTRCSRILILIGPNMPPSVATEMQDVVDRARAGGVNVALGNGLVGIGDGHLVEIDWDRLDQPMLGRSLRHYLVDDATDGHGHLVKVQTTLFSHAINGNLEIVREAVRATIAVSSGIAVTSTADDSGLNAHLYLSADHFSSADLEVLRSYSGC